MCIKRMCKGSPLHKITLHSKNCFWRPLYSLNLNLVKLASCLNNLRSCFRFIMSVRLWFPIEDALSEQIVHSTVDVWSNLTYDMGDEYPLGNQSLTDIINLNNFTMCCLLFESNEWRHFACWNKQCIFRFNKWNTVAANQGHSTGNF